MIVESNKPALSCTDQAKNQHDVTVYAHWSRVLNSEEQKLLGEWGVNWDGNTIYCYNPERGQVTRTGDGSMSGLSRT